MVEHHGAHYDVPYSGDGATGLGKPLKLMARPLRPDLPIYLAALGPKAVELAFEIADGWLPIFWSPERARDVFPVDRARDGFDIARVVPVLVTDDLDSGRDALKEYYAFYVGGMGARGKNFYNDLMVRYGYEAEARAIQDAFLDRRRATPPRPCPTRSSTRSRSSGRRPDPRPPGGLARVGRDDAARLDARRRVAARTRGSGVLGGSRGLRARDRVGGALARSGTPSSSRAARWSSSAARHARSGRRSPRRRRRPSRARAPRTSASGSTSRPLRSTYRSTSSAFVGNPGSAVTGEVPSGFAGPPGSA